MIKKIGGLLIKQRTTITLLVVLILILEDVREKRVPFSLFNVHQLWGPVGALIVLAGVALRSWAAGVLHKNQGLATQGPYAFIRHPLYAGSLLIGLGFSTITGDPENILAILALAIAIYVPKRIYEEKKLAGQYGEAWSAYAAKVPAILPYKFLQTMAAGKGFSLRCWLENRESEAVAACLAGLAVFQLLHALGGRLVSFS
jgi:protein-S-isoprenylcysteine O-methyltransferase Ste14